MIMKKVWFIICVSIIFLPQFVSAKKEVKYPVSELSSELKANAKAVVRYESHEFELKSKNRATEKITYAITILNENGYPLSVIKEFYNKFISIRDISAAVYSAEGKKLHRIKLDDIMDVSATSSFSIYDDNRMKVFEPQTKDYPFTIEYSFEREFNGIFSFPTWHLFKGYNIAVEKAVFVIKSSDPDAIRVNQKNLDCEPEVTNEDGIQVKKWEINNYVARKREPFSQNLSEYTPIIQLAPSFINIKGNEGKYDSWKSYGSFIANLNEGKNDLSEETTNKMKELTKDASTDFEKIKLVYEYMQNKTRYVSIQVGMGGWQPFEASMVDRLGYGDCKALSNYMKSLLESIDIESVYTLVYAGDNAQSLNHSFPSNQFNHAILCVPLEKDTLWLECTSQELPCGFLSDFTDDRDVLLIKEDGGEIARTKAYTLEDNLLDRQVMVSIDSEGNGVADVSAKYTGLQYSDMYGIFGMDEVDREKYMLRRIDIPNFHLSAFNHEEKKAKIPHANENIDLIVRGYASAMGNRLILPLNLMNKQTYVPGYLRKRESDVEVKRSYKDIDKVIYNLPEGFIVEKIPAPIVIESPYGYYEAKAEIEGNTISYTREFHLIKGKYPAESYNDFRGFFEKVSEADEMKCLLTRQ